MTSAEPARRIPAPAGETAEPGAGGSGLGRSGLGRSGLGRRTSGTTDAGASALSRMQRRLGAEPYRPGIWGWILPALVAVFAGILRLRDLATPHLLMFDETYYAKDAFALLTAGYELEWAEDADEAWLSGNAQPSDEAAYVVHPPLGKWLIALGLRVFGYDSAFGWRISAAVAGTLAVLLIAVIAQRMFRSVFLGAFAGMLTAIEGHHLVMSRVALLDIFMMFFVLAAFGALVADRYSGRRRLAEWAVAPSGPGPRLALRPWRLLAAVLLGAAVAVKLSALAFFAVFGVMVILWDLQARRAAGVDRWFRVGLLRDAVPAVLTVLPVAAAVYLASWSGWLFSREGWGRMWHLSHPAEGLAGLVPGPIRSLWNYHVSATDFHQGLSNGHEYASSPWTWPFMGRPVSMHYDGIAEGEVYAQTGETCHASACSSAVLDLANPLIWWAGLIAVVIVLALWLGRRDWRYGAILSGFVAGFLVWLLFPDRTMFFFYTISYHPFLILAITAVAALVLRIGTGAQRADGSRRGTGVIVAARQRNTVILLCFVLLCVAASVFFLPLWTGEMIPYEQWRMRIWIESWL
ncbi:dolichyl-phosphate-mannose--protein mannosyltransferase [Nesterenkonia halotolerans]|uniref:Polyprenol-phosphate-mannose--protein mannosyltransferase n=1 Tax=Nesterenkonia halotolerans TaxID=225325 RepID=A0ABR9J9Y9_9MICC|nr:phospholipid carrier-dependent glycosyltransferase [Nesterenkonia halotolerans]MBE1515812.1 dolichyl-phosphate-mannose--protein O-mannosyl transferase [Nesterenkonia halotolerans]